MYAIRSYYEIMLMDAAHLQEEDAAYANKRGFSKHDPAEPLYTSMDALAALKLLAPTPVDRWLDLGPGMRVRFGNSGHILGAAFVEIRLAHEHLAEPRNNFV